MSGQSLLLPGRFVKWLAEGVRNVNRRRASRIAASSLTAQYYDGAASQRHVMRDISLSGAYIYTKDRWYPGTLIRMAFHASKGSGESAVRVSNTLCAELWCKVLRHGSDGVGVAFVDVRPEERKQLQELLADAMIAASARQAAGSQGHSLIEFSLIVPLMFLLILNTVNFGAYLYAGITVADASRTGAEYAAISGTTYTEISNLVTNSVSSLWNKSSVTVQYCTNASGTISCSGTGPGSPPADPESSYTLASVDVTYTYQPLISAFNFPALGISLTIPSTTVHRRTVMRIMS